MDPNAVSQRYLFETCFDSDRAAATTEPPEPTYTAEDLEKAREAAHAEGEAAGRQDAVNSIEKQLLNGLGRLVEQMGALSDDQMRFQQDLTERSVELALTATRKMFPALAQRDGLIEIDALLTNCLLEAKEEPRILVRVSTALAEPYRERMDALAAAAGYQGTVTILADESFGPADCRVEWTYGGAERVAAQMWQEFDAATQRIFCDPAEDGEDDYQAASVSPASPDGEISIAPEFDPVMAETDTPEALDGQADSHEPLTVDLTAEPTAEPMDEATAEATEGPTAELPVEPAGEPAIQQTEEPTETPAQPDDAATDPGMMPEPAPPQHTATAS